MQFKFKYPLALLCPCLLMHIATWVIQVLKRWGLVSQWNFCFYTKWIETPVSQQIDQGCSYFTNASWYGRNADQTRYYRLRRFSGTGFNKRSPFERSIKWIAILLKILGRISGFVSEEQMLEEAYAVRNASDGLGVRDVDCYPVSLLEKLRSIFPEKSFAAHVAENPLVEEDSIKTSGSVRQQDHLHGDRIYWYISPIVLKMKLKKRGPLALKIVSCQRTNSILGDGIPEP